MSLTSSLSTLLRTTGDGNCLYRACSRLLCGKEDLWQFLRALTSIELYLQKKYYAEHPYIDYKKCFFSTVNTAFSSSVSDKGLGCGYSRDVDIIVSAEGAVIEREAVKNSIPGIFSSLMCLFGLSSVIGMDIVTIYPEEVGRANKYSNMNNGVIKPRVSHSKLHTDFCNEAKICIMWSKDGSDTFIHGDDEDFNPNHFVPLYCQSQKEKPNIAGFSKTSTKKDQSSKMSRKITDFLHTTESVTKNGE